MKKLLVKNPLICIFSLLVSFNAYSQRNNYFEIIGEAAVPIAQKDFGFGLYGKYLIGIKEFSKITVTTGFSRFANQHDNTITSQTTFMLPVFLGYRRSFNSFYVEPQLGFGALNGTIKFSGDYSKPSVAALFWALNAGYQKKNFIAGLRFQSANGIDSQNAGLWYNHTFNYSTIFIGYRFL